MNTNELIIDVISKADSNSVKKEFHSIDYH